MLVNLFLLVPLSLWESVFFLHEGWLVDFARETEPLYAVYPHFPPVHPVELSMPVYPVYSDPPVYPVYCCMPLYTLRTLDTLHRCIPSL